VRSQHSLHDTEPVEWQERLADACEKASQTIAAARVASDRARVVLRSTDQVLQGVARALERRGRAGA
jgi:hypothetical protein